MTTETITRVRQNSRSSGLKNASVVTEAPQEKKKPRRRRRGKVSREAHNKIPRDQGINRAIIHRNAENEASLGEEVRRSRMSANDNTIHSGGLLIKHTPKIRQYVIEAPQEKKKPRRRRRGKVSREAHNKIPRNQGINRAIIQRNAENEASLGEDFRRLRMSANDHTIHSGGLLTKHTPKIRQYVIVEKHRQRKQKRDLIVEDRRCLGQIVEDKRNTEDCSNISTLTEMFAKLKISEKNESTLQADRGSRKRRLSTKYSIEEGPTEPKRLCVQ